MAWLQTPMPTFKAFSSRTAKSCLCILPLLIACSEDSPSSLASSSTTASGSSSTSGVSTTGSSGSEASGTTGATTTSDVGASTAAVNGASSAEGAGGGAGTQTDTTQSGSATTGAGGSTVGEQDEVDDSADTASSDDPSSETGDDPSSETGDDTASETTEADAAGGATSLEPGTDGAGGDSAMGSGGAGDMPTEMGSGGSTETETEPDPEPVVDPELIGWASVSDCGPFGTTGGGSGEATVTVTSGAQLREALTASGPQVIAVSGLIDSPGGLGGVSDKTLLGVDGAEIRGGFGLSGARNVIIKDIVFSDGADDTFELSGGTCVWFDHCEFRDGADGNLDIVRGSDLVTVSWSRFYYTRGHEHMLSNLCGNQQPRAEDEGKINITFHHNWWGAGVKERKPRVRYGKVHVFNNYYRYEPVPNDTGDSYQVAAGYMSKLLVENNYFDGSNTPIRWMSDENTAEVVERGNAFVGTSGEVVTRGAAFEPPYQYTMDQAEAIKDLVLAGAGAR